MVALQRYVPKSPEDLVAETICDLDLTSTAVIEAVAENIRRQHRGDYVSITIGRPNGSSIVVTAEVQMP